MPKAPDWLLNLSAQAPNLIEDSPQRRKEQENTQIGNLAKVTEEGLAQLEERNRQAQMQAIEATKSAIARADAQKQATEQATEQMQMQRLQDTQAQIANVDMQRQQVEQQTEQAKRQALEDQFNEAESQRINAEQILPHVPEQGFLEPSSPPEDPAASVLQLAQITGLPANVVASMVMVGKDIARLEREGKVTRAPLPGEEDMLPQPLPSQLVDQPVPLAGPPSMAPTPGTPPAAPQPVEQPPTLMAPPPEPTPI